MAGIIDRVTALYLRILGVQPAQKKTSSRELPEPPTRPIDFAERLKGERERRRKIAVCNEMYDADPRIKETIKTVARDTVQGGFTVQVKNNPKAAEVANALTRRIKLQTKLDDFVRETFIEGDTFIEVSIDEDEEIAEVTRKPTLPMRRASDRTDRFPDPRRAFWYSDEPVAGIEPPRDAIWFAQWQIIHARWDRRTGRKYGEPMFGSATGAFKRVKEGELDIAVRRKTRAGMKFLHVVKGANEDALNDYKKNNKDALNNPFAAIADFFSNTEGSIQAIQGDARLAEIGDVVHHIETLFTASPAPMAITGYAKGLNRDILEDMLAHYRLALEEIVAWCETEFVVPLLELQWLLAGILPEGLEYEIVWKHKATTTAQDLKDIGDAILKFRGLGVPDPIIYAIIARFLPWLDLSEILEEIKQGEGDGDNVDRQPARLGSEVP